MSEETKKDVTPAAEPTEKPETAAEKVEEAAKEAVEKAAAALNTDSVKKAGGKFKAFISEFEAFALKGNVMDLAVGVIIGAAFQNIVTSLTDNIISPILGLLFRANFDSLSIVLFDGKLKIGYGAFLTAVINFVIMAFVLFCLLKFVNALIAKGQHKEEAPAEEAPKAPTQEELLAQILAELKAQSEVMQEPAE